MKTVDFKKGYIMYENRKESFDTAIRRINPSEWDDGYMALSSRELRKNQSEFHEILAKGKERISKKDGYIMEICLWRFTGSTIAEEISIERENNSFYLQRWKLYLTDHTGDAETDMELLECYYRKIIPIIRKKSILVSPARSVHAFEVVVPKYRLHFFLSVTEN